MSTDLDLSPGTSLPGAAGPISPAAPSFLVGAGEEHAKLDELERRILDQLPAVHLPVTHRFTPFLYAREVFMPTGTVLTSQLHQSTHPYVVLSGVALVAIPGEEPVRLEAGYVGITQAGTRRALYIEEDCRWITFHPLSPAEEAMRQAGATDDELLAVIRERIIGQRERTDDRDVHAEYRAKLAAAGHPGPNDGPRRALEEA